MIFKIIIFIVISLKPSLCSWVVDGMSQDSIFVSDYCPEMKHCKDGTHVMCMYYDETSTIGPLCRNFVETKISPEIKDMILEIINNARSKVATGVAKGLDDVYLPRGYGIMRLKWDKELAIFAQVLANQCFIAKYDECRATNSFANPSQSIALTNFHHPDWGLFTKNNNNYSEPGLTEGKLMYGIKRILESWVPEKKPISIEHVLSYPPLQSLSAIEKSYLNVIRGGATHIGCGVSAFTKFNYADNNRNDLVNMLEVICNFSDSPQVAQPVYMTDPPIPGTGFTDECGCPTGYKESEGCLCEEDLTYHKPTTSTEPPYHRPSYSNQKLKGPVGKTPSPAPNKGVYKSLEVFDQVPNPKFKKRNQETQFAFLPIFKIKNGPNEKIHERSRAEEPSPQIRFDNTTVIARNRDMKYSSTSYEIDERINPEHTKKHTNNLFYYTKNKDSNKELNDNYVTVVSHANPGRMSKLDESVENSLDEIENEDTLPGFPGSHRRNYSDQDNTNLNIINQINDHNIMNLLEILEHKVHSIDMNFKEKEMFDAKMRKIYKAVWSKQMQHSGQAQQTKPMQKLKQNGQSDDIENDFRELNNLLKLKSQHISDNESFHNIRKAGSTENTLKEEEKVMKHVHRQSNNDQHKQKFDPTDNDIIDDKLIEILKHKNNQMLTIGEMKSNNDVNGRQAYMDRHLKDINDHKPNNGLLPINDFEQIDYDDERDYNNLPVSRHQETFYKYDKNDNYDMLDTDDRKVVAFNNLPAYTDVLEYPHRVSHTHKSGKDVMGERRTSHNHKMNKSMRPLGRRMFSYFEDPREHHEVRTYRRMEDYNVEHPHRRFQLNQMNPQWKSKIHQMRNPHHYQ